MKSLSETGEASFDALAAFVRVAQLRSFSKAARQLGVTPSALSHSLRQVEEALGTRLLNRTTRSVTPTEAGQLLLERLSPALQDMQGALREVRELGQVMDRMSDTIQEFLHITRHISAESRLDVMLSSVLYELVQASIGTSGAVYLVNAEHSGLTRTARYCDDPQDQELYPDQLNMAHFINYAEHQQDDAGDAQPVLRVQLQS